MPTPSIRFSLVLWSLLLLAASLLPAAETPGSYLRTYVSTIDNSVQPYGVYVPTPFNEAVPHPVVMNLHGWNGHATGVFTTTQKSYADANGCLIVQIEGRGNNNYDGIAEVDLFDVLAELRASFQLDERRLYIEGASMGASGAYRQGVRHPDRLAAAGGADGMADYRVWNRQWYAPTRDPYCIEPFRLPNMVMDSCVDVADGALWHNLYMIVDSGDTSVWPENTYNFNARLDELAAGSPEADYPHEMHEFAGGHCANYSQPNIYAYFFTPTLKQVPSRPARVICKTTRLKYGTMYWVTIDRLWQINQFAIIDARAIGNQVTISAQNTRKLTLRLGDSPVNAAEPVTVRINGDIAYTGPVKTVTLYAADGGWSEIDPAPGVLHKTAALEGPIGDAYTKTFIVAYGTTGTAEETAANQNETQNFCNRWNTWMHAAIAPRPDTSVTAEEQAACNLILFGTSESNSLLGSIKDDLPISVTRSGITYHGRTYAGAQYGAYFAYPNPANPSHYVVVNHLVIPGTLTKDMEALPWYWPDYVIFDTTRSPGACVQASLNYLPDTFVEVGYFDEDWSGNFAPVAVDDVYSGQENDTLQVNAAGVLGNDTDPDGDAITAVLEDAPAHGALALNPDGGFTYTPDTDYYGDDVFTYRTTDGSKTSEPATVTLHIANTNSAPVAVDDSYTAFAGAEVAVNAPGVLANDSDPDGDELTTTLVSEPQHGTVLFNADGSFTYTPDSSDVTQDSFTYRNSDGLSFSNVATVMINYTTSQYEADVSPRPNGGELVHANDVLQIGRFAAGLDIAVAGGEFQRADCAPRGSRGDGRLSVADWVEAGRYAAGLDPLTAAGGPTAPGSGGSFASPGLLNPIGRRPYLPTRSVSLSKASLTRGKTGNVSVVLDALGGESAVGFGVRFDPARLQFVSAKVCGNAIDSALNMNSAQATSGYVGIALMKPLPQTFRKGKQTIITLTFSVPRTATVGNTVLSFSDQPVLREVATIQGQPVETVFYDSVMRISGAGW
ncbi:MAG: Ig-like domain-containing protein [Armatimonadota bacterium]